MNKDALVFAASNGAPLYQSNFRNQVWYPALRRAGLPHVSPHSLRRTCVDIWIDRGLKMTEVRDMLGHESITVTMNVYKGSASAAQLSEAVQKASGSGPVSDLQQAINAAMGIMQVTDVHSDGRIELVGLHPDWAPRGASATSAPALGVAAR